MQALEKVKLETKAQVVGIVTDNASNMENMRSKILETDVFTYGCQAHILNLVGGDILRDTGRANMSGFIIEVLTKFRNVHALQAALKAAKLPRPPKPSTTPSGLLGTPGETEGGRLRGGGCMGRLSLSAVSLKKPAKGGVTTAIAINILMSSHCSSRRTAVHALG